ncbi:MAG: dTMP kinase [Candidatus Nealsonbacteria bacterium]|nr:dTMP kinase [Candidatus Nealsonbacteria bacterium]
MQKNTYKGKFIVFEGLDGSGQSTQTNLLGDFLVGKGYEVILTKEPTKDSEAGQKIRQVLDKNTQVSPMYLQELFAQDRGEHLDNLIIPALKEGKMIVSDRYFFSSFAYGASSGVEAEELIKLNSEFLMPDLTIILKVRPEVCMERIGKRGGSQTLFEEAEKLKKVWQTYETLPRRFENAYIIDGEKSIEKVHENVKALLQEKFNIRML